MTQADDQTDSYLNTAVRCRICLFACLVTISVWILELRTRHLLAILNKRGRGIERDQWGLTGAEHYSGFFSRQTRIPDEIRKEHEREHHYSIVFFSSRVIPRWLALRITHSFGLDSSIFRV